MRRVIHLFIEALDIERWVVIRDWEEMERFEQELQKKEKLTLEQRFEIFNAMVEHAREMGIFPPDDPLEGIENDIELAQIMRKYAEFVKESSGGFGQKQGLIMLLLVSGWALLMHVEPRFIDVCWTKIHL